MLPDSEATDRYTDRNMEAFTDNTGISVAVESLIGGRSENQDSYGTARTELGLLVVVCDGMGGGPAGRTASSLAVQTIIDYVSTENSKRHKASILADAVTAANKAVLDKVAQNPEMKGMGTTCVAILIDDKEAYIVHVGDSRCYQLRGNRAVFRTADHSHVGEMVRHGTLTEEEARTSPYSNVITRAIGAEPTVQPELDTVEYKPGDRFALMTDGIWGVVPEPQLVKFLTANVAPSKLTPEICRNIDALGSDNGGHHDNLTLAIIDIPPRGAAAKAQASAINEDTEIQVVESHRETKKDLKVKKGLPVVSIIIAVVCVGVVFLLFFLLRHRDEETIAKEEAAEVAAMTAQEPQETPSPVAVTPAAAGNAVSNLQTAIQLLDSLRNYDPVGKDFIPRKQERSKLCDNIEKELEQAAASEPNPVNKEKIAKILEEVKRDKKKLMQIDGKQYKSTKESLETIDAVVRKLKEVSGSSNAS